MTKTDIKKEKDMWDQYWLEENEKLSIKKRILLFIRNGIFVPEITRYLNKYFKEGTYLEAGSGSGSTSNKLNKLNKKIIAMDLSEYALIFCKKNPKIDKCIQGNIFKMPLKDNSLDGIWNSGVMEHFYKEEVLELLKEFNRVLKKDGRIILFWPSCKLPISWLIDQIINLGVDLPHSVWNPRKKDLFKLLKKAGFKDAKIKISFTLNHYIVIANKK